MDNEGWKTFNYQLSILNCLLVVFVLVACTGPSDSVASTGTLKVEISDHREAIGDFERLDMTIERIGLHPANAPRTEGWLEFEPAPAVVNLTQVIGGSTVTVLQSPIPSGAYDAVRLAVSGGEGTLKTGDAAMLPGFEEAARFEFTLRAGETITLVLDITVESLEEHPGGGYEMKFSNTVSK
jgi:hypothetical protein